MKKATAILLSLLMLLGVMTGCASEKPAAGQAEGAPQSGEAAEGQGIKDTLIIGTAADVNSLDLQNQSDQINNICLRLTHQTLCTQDNEGNFIPLLAESWEWTDDTHLVFHLPENACFSTGEPLTAADVVYTFEMAVDSYVANNLTGLVSVEALSDYDVEFTTESYSNEMVNALAYTPFSIQSKAAYDSGMERPYLVGSGQYVFKDQVEGEYISFEKNEKYWDDDPGVTQTITFKPILESSARVIALQNGEIDVCIDPPSNELQYLEEDENVTVFSKAGTRLFYFGFNTTVAPWDNQTLRQAVACAIDRDTIIDVVLGGRGKKQTTVLNRGLWSFYDDMEGFDYDVERAKKLMAEAGYPDGGIETTLSISSGSPYETIVPIIQANLAAIGITVNIETLEAATLKSVCVEGNHQLFLWRWNATARLDEVFRDLFYTGSGSNYHHYSDPKADALTDQILVEKDEDKRRAESEELQTYLVNACPQVPLFIADLVIAYNKGLQGTNLYGGGNHDWSHAYVQE